MYIIEAIPLGRGNASGALSYFSHKAYPVGSLVDITVRSKTQSALVVSSADAFSMKAALRAATFSLRKLPDQEPKFHLSPRFLETAERMARFHGAPLGSTLFALIPKELREGTVSFRETRDTPELSIPPHDGKPRILIAPAEDRYREYRRMVRESFAAGHSIVFVLPTIEHALRFRELLDRGIERYTALLHGGRPKETFKKAYDLIHDEQHPLLIVATPQYACIERPDIGTVILEHNRSAGYRGRSRPYLDYRTTIGTHASLHGRTLILADTIPRTEDVFDVGAGSALSVGEMPKRLELPGSLVIIPMKPEADGTIAFKLFSRELLQAVADVFAQKKRAFLFSARRGLAPLVTCVDCGHIFRDPESGAPLSLLATTKNGEERRTLISSVSGYRVRMPDICPSCGSWRLRGRGIGIQHVYDELSRYFPDKHIILLDRETAGTHKKADSLRNGFYAEKGVVLVGTALAIPYISKPVEMSAIVSMDSLRALPSWRQQEETFGIMMTLRERTLGTVFVQTRTEDDITDHVRKGSVAAFFDVELGARKTFNYPPYSVFVHLTWLEDGNAAGGLHSIITERFAPYGISIYSAPYTNAGRSVRHGLMRVPTHDWPNDEIVSRLRELPPSVRVMINPDRIV